jgi:hypothetical protein
MIRLLAQMLMLTGLAAAVVWVAALGLHLQQTPIALDVPATAAAAHKRAPPATAKPVQPALATFSQSLTRPLFFEGRRLPVPQPKQVKAEPSRPPPPPPPPPKPAVLPDKIKLLGIILRADDRRALIEIPPQPAAWFKVADRIADWTIDAIEDNQVVFTHPSKRVATLALYSDTAGK